MSNQSGTALAVIDNKRPRAAKAEKLPPAEHLIVPGAIMLAADAVSSRDDNRPMLQGIYLHSKDGVGRVTATDGTRMFIASFPLLADPPSWLAGGIIISNDGLKPRLTMIAKEHETGAVRISYARGAAKVELTDVSRSIIFQAALSPGPFPEYERVLQVDSFGAKLDEDGRPIGREWEPVGINSVYLKHCAEIAKTLDAGLPKGDRSKAGMVVRAFNTNGEDNAPLVFDFSTWPGAILVIMPVMLSSSAKATSKETAALLAPAVKLTLAALRAHATRNQAWADQAEDAIAKAGYLAKVEHFNERIAEVLKRAPGLPALEDQSEAPTPDGADSAESSETEADKPAEDPAPEQDAAPANDEPRVTRRRVAIKNRAAKRTA